MIKIILTFCFLVGGSGPLSAAIVTNKELKLIEEEFQKKIQSKDLDQKKKFYAYVLAGRELYQYRFYEKAESYYEEAKKFSINEDKSEAYINQMAIALVEENKPKLKARLEEAKKYYSREVKYKKPAIDYYLNSIEAYLGGTGKAVKGFYGKFVQEENLIDQIKKKDYDKALSSLNPASLAESKNSFDITLYDSLNVVVNKKAVMKLYCDEDYKKYPNSYAYSILICGLLNDYLHQGTFDKKRLARAETYFKEEAPDKMYILDMVKDIK